MAFGQQSGPPAGHRQLKELTTLLESAGFTDFRDARGALGLTQRQAGGKFTSGEADEFIQQLEEAAEVGEVPTATASTPAPKAPAADKGLEKISDKRLAAEMQRRGWVVMEP